MSDILLTASQRQFHDSLLEHESAPRFNFTSTDMLTPDRLAAVRRFEYDLPTQRFWAAGQYPDWLVAFLDETFRTVPFYKRQGRCPKTFEAIPPIGREVLHREPWHLVPDHVSLEALTVYTTSGTTGSALAIPTHPTVSSMLLVLMEKMLATRGVHLPRGEGQVAIALVACQQQTLTYASLSQALDGAGFLKLNLAAHEWRDAKHRREYLVDAAPAVVTGSPQSFQALAELVPELRPQALVSSAVALHPGHAARLSQQFACPVFDLYSMTEARAIAGRAGDEECHTLLSPDLYIEILGPHDEPLPAGQVGEIVLTGGRNPYFPMLRYRTGDRAALAFQGAQPYLERFEGRASVHLENARGDSLPTLDVVHALKALPLVGFSLSQFADRAIEIRYAGEVRPEEVGGPLEALFSGPVKVRREASWQGKPHRFSSALAAATPPE